MSKRVFVTGLGIISAIGHTIPDTLAALRLGRTGIGKISYLDTLHKNDLLVGEVKYSNEELLRMTGVLDHIPYTRTALLGMLAAKSALQDAGIEDVKAMRTGLISATSVGGMDKGEQFYADFIKNNSRGRLKNIVTHDCGDSTENMADYLGIKDYISTISTACSSSANAIMFGARLIKNNLLDRVIVGGTDALTKFTLNGFNTLMILDKNECKPFDENRKGLNLGEGAGFIVIESEKAVNASGKKVLGELTGYANANDAYHQTASSPEGHGAYLAMKQTLEMSGLDTSAISYINAHGTGTPNNDLSEGRAIEKIFASGLPKISSTKAFTGHTLGACGGIEAIFALLAINHDIVMPNLNFSTQMKELNFTPVTELLTEAGIRHVMSNSLGFGGNCSSLLFSKV
ncbi:MAG: beta-ketoacyl-[acyl-carrier-protein] synthase family protein [Bacteroidota bacterium]